MVLPVECSLDYHDYRLEVRLKMRENCISYKGKDQCWQHVQILKLEKRNNFHFQDFLREIEYQLWSELHHI